MTSRLRLADPTPTTASEVAREHNYFQTEVRLFQAGVRMSTQSGMVTLSFPLAGAGSTPLPELPSEEDEAEAEIAAPTL